MFFFFIHCFHVLFLQLAHQKNEFCHTISLNRIFFHFHTLTPQFILFALHCMRLRSGKILNAPIPPSPTPPTSSFALPQSVSPSPTMCTYSSSSGPLACYNPRKMECGHLCCLEFIPNCCKCSDRRPNHERSYRYVDGHGVVILKGISNEGYCPVCKRCSGKYRKTET